MTSVDRTACMRSVFLGTCETTVARMMTSLEYRCTETSNDQVEEGKEG